MDQQHPTIPLKARSSKSASPLKTPPELGLADPTAAATLPIEVSATEMTAPAMPKSRTVLTTGWHDLSEEAYHSDPCPLPSLSSHTAMNVIGKSLLHAWRGHPRSPIFEPHTVGSAADRGSAAHALLFGGKAIEPIATEDYRTAAARDARDQARTKGRIPMLQREIEGLLLMTKPAQQRLSDLHNGPYLCEQSAIWRSGDTQAGWRRGRIDTLSPSRALIVDYKTTEAAVDALSCERRIADMRLHIQAAAYVDAVETLQPELRGRVRFVFQWQEQKAPYALSPPIEMSEAFMSLGRAQWQAAGRLWDLALKHCAFPGYSAYPHLACPPPWELSRWEERQQADPALAGVMS